MSALVDAVVQHPDAYRSPADIVAVAAALHALDRRRWHGSSSSCTGSSRVHLSGVGYGDDVEDHSSSSSEPHQPQHHNAAARAGGSSLASFSSSSSSSSSDAAVEVAETSSCSSSGGGGGGGVLTSIGHGLHRYLSAAPVSLLQSSDAGLDTILNALGGRQRQPPAQFYGDLWAEMRSGIRCSGAGALHG